MDHTASRQDLGSPLRSNARMGPILCFVPEPDLDLMFQPIVGQHDALLLLNRAVLDEPAAVVDGTRLQLGDAVTRVATTIA